MSGRKIYCGGASCPGLPVRAWNHPTSCYAAGIKRITPALRADAPAAADEKQKPKALRVCDHCGAEYRSNYSRSRFCGLDCKDAAHAAKRKALVARGVQFQMQVKRKVTLAIKVAPGLEERADELRKALRAATMKVIGQ